MHASPRIRYCERSSPISASDHIRVAWPLLTLFVASCGGGKQAPPPAEPAVASEAGFAHPHIAEPANGEELSATGGLGDHRNVRVKVRGEAEPNSDLIITTGCEFSGCQVNTGTDAKGRFAAEVQASATAENPRASIIVSYDPSQTIDSDRVLVIVKPPAANSDLPTKAPKTKKTHRAGREPTAVPPAATAPPLPTTTTPRNPAPAATAPAAGGRSLVVIGDSLAEGMKPYLAQVFPGWRITTDARVGRPLAEGMNVLTNMTAPAGAVYAFSLFTNDDPRSVAALERAVRTSVQRAGASGCVIWATIVRPPVGGVSYDAANAGLARLSGELSGRLVIADWAGAVRANPGLVGGDGVHAGGGGYRTRAALYAAAVAGCR